MGRPEILHGRLQRAPRAPGHSPCPCLRRKARQLLFLCFLTPSGLPFSEHGAQSSAGGSQEHAWRGECDQRRAWPLYSENRKASLSILLLGGQWGWPSFGLTSSPHPGVSPSPRWAGHPAQGLSCSKGRRLLGAHRQATQPTEPWCHFHHGDAILAGLRLVRGPRSTHSL